ncbi:ABC transporter substrate-binding protein [Actinomadura parmotrematis]|uniref:ABC transporter substrate-binding protein n=1 Tax=Actinomadura parmotrematis TaxID=2864039 RepID=A0ABS7FZV3_9ACTN|nr:ABC transporter substrate-binding protein [Actinomadura parmotrematis]MBW8485976.1 ABC transporter substrate-binding protein [Actinomadura parmotrematis]
MSRRLGALAITAGLAVAVTGCSGGKVRPAASARTASFVYSFNLNVVTDWDPATSYSNEIIAMQNVYESLTRYDSASRTVKPRLAEKWTRSADGKVWTFTLRDGVKFHTGTALTSAAAKKAIERTVAGKGGAAYIWDPVKTIETPDPRTLVFKLKYAAPLDLISAADYGAYIYDTAAPGGGDLKKYLGQGHDTGSGPYTVAQWNKGQEAEVRLGQFKGYWGGWSGAHYTGVEFRDTPQVTTAWQQLRARDVTYVHRLNPQLFAQAKSTGGIGTQATPSFQNLLAFFNTAAGPLKDVALRKAVQNAIDYDGLVAALKGSGTIASGIVPNGLVGATTSLALHQNTAEAKRLLNQAGYGPGKKSLTLSLTYAQGDDDQQTFVTLLSSALKQLNVTLRAKPMQWDAQWDQAKNRDAAERQDIFVMYWYPDYPDAYSWFTNLFRSADPVNFNLTYLDDPGVDKRIDALPQLTATYRTSAQQAYEDLQRELVVDKAVVAPLFVQQYQRAFAKDVGGYTDDPAYPNVVFAYDARPAS